MYIHKIDKAGYNVKIFLYICLLPVFSCIGCGSTPNVYGAWQTVTDPKYAQNITDSIVFEESGSLKIYYVQNSKVVDSLLGKFYINKNQSWLKTEFDTNKFQFDLVELKSTSLQMKQTGKSIVLKLRRLTN